MIKSITAVTREIDDAQAAVAEITEILKLEENLLKNSLGIISCFSDFDETGVLKAICDALPFDCIGSTSSICSACGEIEQIIFAITVLTSDDCDFKALSIPFSDHFEDSVAVALTELHEQRGENPALFLSYFPLINTTTGDKILKVIDKVTGGIPLFGTAAVDHNTDFSTAKTIYNGEAYRDVVVLGAIYGAPNVAFEIASIDGSKVRSQKAVITESDGNILIGVNGKTALVYLEEIGLTRDQLTSGLEFVPLVVDLKDGTKPIARAIFDLTPEGYAVCGGVMPEGATLGIGRFDMEDVVKTTEEVLGQLADCESTLLSYSCIARYLVLGADNTAEAEKVRDLAVNAPYLFACSSGEICPLPDAGGKLKNFYHNYTNVFCRLS